MKLIFGLLLFFLFFGILTYLLYKTNLYFSDKYSKWHSYIFYEFNRYEKIYDPNLFNWHKFSLFLFSNGNEHLIYPDKFNWGKNVFFFLEDRIIDMDQI